MEISKQKCIATSLALLSPLLKGCSGKSGHDNPLPGDRDYGEYKFPKKTHTGAFEAIDLTVHPNFHSQEGVPPITELLAITIAIAVICQKMKKAKIV